MLRYSQSFSVVIIPLQKTPLANFDKRLFKTGLSLYSNNQCFRSVLVLNESGSGSSHLAEYQSGSEARVLMSKQKWQFIYTKASLHKIRPSYRRSLQPFKRTSSTSKHEISRIFFFVGHFCPPGFGSRSESRSNPDKDKKH